MKTKQTLVIISLLIIVIVSSGVSAMERPSKEPSPMKPSPMEPSREATSSVALPPNVQKALEALKQRASAKDLSLYVLCRMLVESFELARSVSYNQRFFERVYEVTQYLLERIEAVMDIRNGQPPCMDDLAVDFLIREIYTKKRMQVADRQDWYLFFQQGTNPYWG